MDRKRKDIGLTEYGLQSYIKAPLDQREKEVGGRTVQRDLYCAYLLKNADKDYKRPDRRRCIDGYERFLKMQEKVIWKMKEQGISPNPGVYCENGVITRMDIGKLNIHIIKSNRKSIAIEVRPDMLLVRVPSCMTQREIESFILEKRQWIEKHVQSMQERQSALSRLKPYTIEEIQALADKALKVIPPKVRHYAALLGVDYGRITIRNQRSRWGSCSSKGNLNFNCMLMLFPDEVIDSVVVHELCHRKHMNHSPQFYAEIARVFPNYQRCHKWLKENGSMYLSRMP